MTLARRPYLLWIPLLLGLIALGAFRRDLWLLAVVAGVALLAAAFVPVRRKEFGSNQPAAGGALMQSPETWNEKKIESDLMHYQRKGGGLVGQYIGGIVERFLVGQDAHTLEVRTRYLEKFNKYAEVSREAYKWQAYMESERAEIEEEIELLKVKVEKKKLEKELNGDDAPDPEVVDLQKRIERMKLQLELARIEKEKDDLNKPAPEGAKPLSAREIRERKMNGLTRREKEIREELAALDTDTSLPEDIKQRKRNALEEKLSEILEEQVALL